MNSLLRAILVVSLPLLAVLATPPGRGDEKPAPLTPEQLVALEEVRAAVESALETYLQPLEDGGLRIENAIRAGDTLIPFGADVVPFLENELEQERSDTFDFCAYTLGRLKIPEAEAALRRSIERSEAGEGEPDALRTAWAGFALGLHGRADVLEVLIDGKHEQTPGFPMFSRTSVFEAVALQTAPESLPILIGMLERYAKEEDRKQDVGRVLDALRRIASVEILDVVIPYTTHADRRLRLKAVAALGVLDQPASMEALAQALSDEEAVIRRTAAAGLARMTPRKALLEEVSTLVGTETDVLTRKYLYRVLAAVGGAKNLKVLRQSWQSADLTDRRNLTTVFGGHPSLSDLLETAFRETDAAVASAALQAMIRNDPSREKELVLRAIDIMSGQALPFLGEEAARLGLTEAGPRLTERLIDGTLRRAGPSKMQDTPRTRALGAALSSLRHVEAIEPLKKTAETIADKALRAEVLRLVARLELERSIGDDVAGWLGVLRTDSVDTHRLLAAERAAQLGGGPAESGLAAFFDGLDPENRRDRELAVAIVRQAGFHPNPELTALLKRILIDPAFDHPYRQGLRDTAAWAAWKIGGTEMFDHLAASIRRRDGRDFRVFVYAFLLGRDAALPLLDELATRRMEFLGWQRAAEQEALLWIASQVRAGRPLEAYERPPNRFKALLP